MRRARGRRSGRKRARGRDASAAVRAGSVRQGRSLQGWEEGGAGWTDVSLIVDAPLSSLFAVAFVRRESYQKERLLKRGNRGALSMMGARFLMT